MFGKLSAETLCMVLSYSDAPTGAQLVACETKVRKNGVRLSLAKAWSCHWWLENQLTEDELGRSMTEAFYLRAEVTRLAAENADLRAECIRAAP